VFKNTSKDSRNN